MPVVFGRVVPEMLGGPAGFMLAIRSDHAPAELKSEDRQDEVDEATGEHEEKYSMGHRSPFAQCPGGLMSNRRKTIPDYTIALFSTG